MLIYHPAFDAYHCVFRLLFATSQNKSLEIQKLRILDYYLVFPAELGKMRLLKEHSSIRKKANKAFNIYHGPVNSIQTFRGMEHIQNAAISALGAVGCFEAERLTEGIVQRTDASIPLELEQHLSAPFTYSELATFTIVELAQLRLNGPDGLKDRSGLMEYKYDNV